MAESLARALEASYPERASPPRCPSADKWGLRVLYMIVEHYQPGAAAAIYRRARELGRQLPAGLEYLDSWVDLEYRRCFQLMRTEDPSLFTVWMRAWSDLVRFEVIAVRTSAEAARLIVQQD